MIKVKSKISVLGCGWLGKPLAMRLIEKGYSVNGSTRSWAKTIDLRAVKIVSFVLDIEDMSGDFETFLNADILIVNITSRNISGYQRLVRQVEKSSITNVVFVSSTSVYKAENTVVTEETVIDGDSPLGKIEDLFKGHNKFKTTIVRFAGLFGYSRKPGNFFSSGKKIADPDGFVNLIHRDDCIQIIEQLIEQAIWNEVFNGCADSHPTKLKFYTKAALAIGNSPPEVERTSELPYKIVSGKKLTDRLQLTFRHPDLMDLKKE
jgi:nucleoside-diphosphate-sugar epimerase